MRNYLEMMGHRVVEASHVEEAINRFEQAEVDVVAASLDLAGGGAVVLRKELSARATPPAFLALASDKPDTATASQFEECLPKLDRESVAKSLERLSEALNENAHASMRRK